MHITKAMIVGPFCASIYGSVSLPWILLRTASWHTTITIMSLRFNMFSFFRLG